MLDIHAYLNMEIPTQSLDDLKQDMERYQIQSRVVTPWRYKNTRKANSELSRLVSEEPNLFVCYRVNPKDEDVIDYVKEGLSNDKVVMFEFDSLEDGYYPDVDKRLEEVVELINTNPKPIKVFTGIGSFSMPHQWEVVAKRHKDLNFILLHCACFDYGYSCVDIVGRNENIFVETSNQYELQILSKMFTNLDSNKIVFGSSYGKRLTRSAIEVFDNYDFTENDKNNIFEGNSNRLIGVR